MVGRKLAGPAIMALIALSLMIGTSAEAQTPAGTTIRNQASATFQDQIGNTYTATSNEVITIVLPVYGVSVLPDDSGETPPVTPAMVQTAIPGQTIYYSYNLSNSGNDDDTYSVEPLLDGANTTMAIGIGDLTIYHDLNFNGVLDGGEPAVSSGGTPGNVGPVAAGATVNLLVSYQVPAGASAGELSYVGMQATSAGDGAQVDSGNYHRTDVVSDAAVTASMSAVPANVDPGNTAAYTINGANVGNDTANGVTVPSVSLTGVLIYDLLPTDPLSGNPLALSGSPSGAPSGGTVLYLPAGSSTAGSPESWSWSMSSAAGDIAVAYITNGDMAIGQNYNFSYDVVIPSGMPAGIISNDASVAYVDNNPGTPDPTQVTTNNTQINVNINSDVLIGPDGSPGAGTPPDYDDDSQAVAQAYANRSVDFTNTVINNGNSADEINIILDGASTIPAGWSVQFFRNGGSIPLSDSGSDGIVDVGSVPSGASVDFIVRVSIPSDAVAGGPYTAVVRSQSTNDPTVSNLTTDEITHVNPAAVDIGNYDGAAGIDDTPVNQNADPGNNVDFALDIVNTGGSSDNYSLSASYPAGWGVVYYEDANGNGLLDVPELTVITGIGPVAAGGEVSVIARVTVPGGEVPGVNNIGLTATSNNNGAVFDEIINTVTINSAASVTISPDRSGTGTAGGTIRYDHTVTNTGNVDDTFMLSFASSNGWSYSFFDASNNPISSVTLTAGTAENIVVQVSIPGGSTNGTVENGTVTVTGNATAASDSALDVTTIVAGNLVLDKSVNPAGNQVPGTELTYRTDYSNVGTADLDTIVIYDAIPGWTQYRVGSATSGTLAAGISSIAIEFSNDGGTSWTYTPASGAGGAPANFDATVTDIRWVLAGSLSGGDGTTDGVGFVVRIIAE